MGWRRKAAEKALGTDPLTPEPDPLPSIPCFRCGHVHEGACSRPYGGYALPDTGRKAPDWTPPLAPPPRWMP